MNLGLLAGVLRARSALRAHELWSRDELNAYQARALRDLREFAVASSPFYRGFHAGLENAPLQALPITTKQHVMARFDEFVHGDGKSTADSSRAWSAALDEL